LSVTNDELRDNLLYDITKTDKGISLSVQNQKEILEGVAFITEQAVLFESYRKNKQYQSMIQDNDQKEAAQYNLAKQAMDIRKKSWMLKNRNR
jgi:predicted histidine transporter YuiF (NhaC family)